MASSQRFEPRRRQGWLLGQLQRANGRSEDHPASHTTYTAEPDHNLLAAGHILHVHHLISPCEQLVAKHRAWRTPGGTPQGQPGRSVLPFTHVDLASLGVRQSNLWRAPAARQQSVAAAGGWIKTCLRPK